MFKLIEKYAINEPKNLLCSFIYILGMFLGLVYLGPMSVKQGLAVGLPKYILIQLSGILVTVLFWHMMVRIARGTKGIGETYRITALVSILNVGFMLLVISLAYIFYGSAFFSCEVFPETFFRVVNVMNFIVSGLSVVILVRAFYLFKKIKIARFFTFLVIFLVVIGVGFLVFTKMMYS